MNNRLTIAIALVAGLLGGLLTRYITPSVAFAQDKTPVTKEVRARSFTLVDSSDRTIGTFTAEPIFGEITGFEIDPNGQVTPQVARPPMRIVLRDFTGREIWTPSTGMKILPAVTGNSKK